MTDFRQTIHNRIHNRLGQKAVYVPPMGEPLSVTVKLRLGVAVYGEGMEFVGDEDQLMFLLTDIGDATKKDLFVVAINGREKQYQLIKPLQNDGVRAVWSVRCVD